MSVFPRIPPGAIVSRPSCGVKKPVRLPQTFLFLLLFLGNLPAPRALELFVSILPQQALARALGGEHLQVHVLVGPGQNPATYEPTASQLASLSRADLYWRIGVPVEYRWLPRLRRLHPRMKVLDAREGIPLLAATRDRGGAPRADPHIWMDPNRARIMVARLGETLARLDPAHAEEYRTRTRRLTERLRRLDADIRRRLACLRTRTFMAFHPAWSYFAAAYGLHQLAIEREGKRPGPRRLAHLVAQAKRRKIRLILVQQQFSTADARAVAEAAGAHLVRLDPLSADYFGMMESLVATLREYLGCRHRPSASKT